MSDTIPNVDEEVYSGFGEKMTGTGFPPLVEPEPEPPPPEEK